MERKRKRLGKPPTDHFVLSNWRCSQQDGTNSCPTLSLTGKKPHKILYTWLRTSRWMYTAIKHQKKLRKPRHIWLISPAQNIWVLDQTCSSYQSMNKWRVHHPGKILHCSDTDLLWYPLKWDRETHVPHTDRNQFRNTNNAFFPVPYVSATHGLWEQLTSQNGRYFRAVPLYQECSGSFAWLWDVSVLHQENRILTLYQRWNNVIVNEWGFCFPPKELQAVSYFELRDPFIFWLFLLLTLISSADISAAHVIW